jgi:hypothetical protein
MSEPAPAPESVSGPAAEFHSFDDVLRSLLGKVVMFVNAESFEEGGLGYTLEAGWYRGKLTSVGKDYLVVVSEFKHGVGKQASRESITQYVPKDKVKRITVMKTQILVHI